MTKVEVYTTRVCSYCLAAKSLLKARGIPFEEVDVSDDHEKRMWLAQTSGQRTVPQIFIGGRPIGGYRDLKELVSSGELNELLAGLSSIG